MGLCYAGLLLFGLIVTVNSEDCSTQYQAALQQVLDLKETCSEAVYKDCCEVGYTTLPVYADIELVPDFHVGK